MYDKQYKPIHNKERQNQRIHQMQVKHRNLKYNNIPTIPQQTTIIPQKTKIHKKEVLNTNMYQQIPEHTKHTSKMYESIHTQMKM